MTLPPKEEKGNNAEITKEIYIETDETQSMTRCTRLVCQFLSAAVSFIMARCMKKYVPLCGHRFKSKSVNILLDIY